MYYYMSEGEAQYMDIYHGQFSKKLAEWAVNKMEKSDGQKIKPFSEKEVSEILTKYNIKLDESMAYTAYYLFNMACADYEKSIPNKEAAAYFVDETINDPDCKPEAVLACFRAKMDVMGVPILWERFI